MQTQQPALCANRGSQGLWFRPQTRKSPLVQHNEALRLHLKADVTASQDSNPSSPEKVSAISRPGAFIFYLLLPIYQESEKLAQNTLKFE